MRIGIFDSGFGGLDIARSIVSALPDYDYLYLGDTARAPYGHRSQETIYEYTKQAVNFLFKQKCGLIIIACNTSSSEALRRLQKDCLRKHGESRKILGVLIPAAEDAVSKTNNNKIGVIATEATVKSKAFVRELKKLDAGVRIFQQACPLLVPLVEAGKQNSKEIESLLTEYLRSLLSKRIDTLILGCTHYGILEKNIRKVVGSDVNIISEARAVPKKLEDYLNRHAKLDKSLHRSSTIRFYSTDKTDKFRTLGGKFFGRPIKVEKAVLT